MWTGDGGVGVGGASGHTKSREIKLLTPSAAELLAESNPAFFLFSQTVLTGCERWVKGGWGNCERGRAAEREGQTDRWMDGLSLCKRKLRGRTQLSPVVCQDGAHRLCSSSQSFSALMRTDASQQTQICSTKCYFPKYNIYCMCPCSSYCPFITQ